MTVLRRLFVFVFSAVSRLVDRVLRFTRRSLQSHSAAQIAERDAEQLVVSQLSGYCSPTPEGRSLQYAEMSNLQEDINKTSR